IARTSTWIRAEHDGLLHLQVRLGEPIRKGDCLGTIRAALGAEVRDIIAPRSAIAIGSLTMPVVNEGDAICHIALFDEIKQAELSVERFVDELDVQPPAM